MKSPFDSGIRMMLRFASSTWKKKRECDSEKLILRCLNVYCGDQDRINRRSCEEQVK